MVAQLDSILRLMKRNRSAKKKIALVMTFVATIGTLLFAAVSPETRLGYWLFRCVYTSPIAKKPLLESYRSKLWAFEGGYIPELTDYFLCSRLESASLQTEIDAIVNFYVLQASGREGKRITSLSDGAKQKVLGSIMQNLDGYDVEEAGRALLLVEEIRRSEVIWKGSFGSTNAQESINWSSWWRKRGLGKVKNSYRKWWQSQAAWPVKKTQNPLAGSGIEASGP